MTPLLSQIPESPDNKAIRELRDELKDLNKNLKESNRETSKFSGVLAVLTLIQIAIALWQFVFQAQTSENKWLGLFFIIVLSASIFWILKKFGVLDNKK